jgi:mono/diheme cytochrome c family protein
MGRWLKHPLGQAALVMVLAWVVFEWGIALLPPLFGVRSAPVPTSVLFQYMLTVLVGVLLWVSDSEDRWTRFKEPIGRVLVEPRHRFVRIALLVTIPALVAFLTYDQVRPSVSAPPSLRSIHPAPPGRITFRGREMVLAGLENPLRTGGSLEEHYETGKRVYVQNCMACHGDALDGQGHYARGFNPTPLNFRDNGTIAQLTESFVFWRIAKGGPGLPREGTPWDSAMPAWEDFLTEEEIWSVIIFLYEQTGWEPRTWEESTGAEGEHG